MARTQGVFADASTVPLKGRGDMHTIHLLHISPLLHPLQRFLVIVLDADLQWLVTYTIWPSKLLSS